MRIGIDLDGVLCNSLPVYLRQAWRMFGLRIPVSQITCYRLEDCTPLTKEQTKQIYTTPFPLAYAKPVRGAVKAMQVFSKHYVKTHIVTARPPALEVNTEHWLNAMNIPWLVLSFTKDKSAYALENNTDIFIEDCLENALDLSRVCSLVYLLAYKYNEPQGELPGNVLRLKSWYKIVSDLRRRGYLVG